MSTIHDIETRKEYRKKMAEKANYTDFSVWIRIVSGYTYIFNRVNLKKAVCRS